MEEHNNGPYRLVLNAKAVAGIDWHVHHYSGRGVMKKFGSAAELAADMKIPISQLKMGLDNYNAAAAAKHDKWGTRFFPATPFEMNEEYAVGIITPVAHYTMGGVAMDTKCRVIRRDNSFIPGLTVAGEATGGVHARNRLGGNGLLEAVVFGRLAGSSAVDFLQTHVPAAAALSASTVTISIPQVNGSTITVSISGSGVVTTSGPAASAAAFSTPSEDGAAVADEKEATASQGLKSWTMEEVSKHNTEQDCWLVVDGKVLNVTNFLGDHPGGKMAILTFAGKDATEMFNMVHEEGVIEKFAPEVVIGALKPSSKL